MNIQMEFCQQGTSSIVLFVRMRLFLYSSIAITVAYTTYGHTMHLYSLIVQEHLFSELGNITP